jgi:hypothetical protein
MTGEGQYCNNAWPAGDSDKWRSADAKCRTVPSTHIIEDLSEWKFGGKDKPFTKGLCSYGCDDGDLCRNSWPINDPQKWNSPYAMSRCKPTA